MKKSFLWMLTLLYAVVQGAWAQTWTEVSTKDALVGSITDDAYIKLTKDIQLNSYLDINGKTVTIDLNGHKLSRSLSEYDRAGHVIWVHEGSTLTLMSNAEGHKGIIEGGKAYNGGAVHIPNGNTVTATNVTFKNNSAFEQAGAIWNNGKFTAANCTFWNNTATDVGAIYNSLTSDGAGEAVLTNCTFNGNVGTNGAGALANALGATVMTIDNCTITGNTAGTHGGAIWNGGMLTATNSTFANNTANDVGAIYNAVSSDGTVAGNATLTGCTFTGNVSTTGAGALANAVGTTVMTIDGCTIQGNTAGSNGGGIWNGGTLNMKGTVTVTGNKKASGVNHNVFLKSGTVITVTGSLAGSSIGIDMEGTSGTFTSGYNSYHGSVDPTTVFTPDLSVIVSLGLDTNGEACLTSTGSLYYVERSWDDTNKQVVSTMKGLTELIAYGTTPAEGQYKEVTNAPADSPNEWYGMGGYSTSVAEYYVVRGDVRRETIVVQGKDVHLILCNNARLTLTGGLKLEGDNKLHIHCQSYSGDMGQLFVSNSYDNAAGIGSAHDNGLEQEVGELVIHGGYIVATGGIRGAGIGSCARKTNGKSQLCKSVTVYGGYVRANGGMGGAGIGSGSMENNGEYNDDSTAGTVRIYDGTVIATGGKEGGAGIGGGWKGSGATVFVYGGTVSANGGEEYDVETDETTTVSPAGYGGAGIGGGSYGRGGDVTITGGTVFAWAAAQQEGNRAIGSGYNNEDNGFLSIGDEMMVEAGNNSVDKNIYNADERKNACSSCFYAEVSPCTHSGSTYTIVDGFTHHNDCTYCLISSNVHQTHAYNSSGKCCCGLIGLENNASNDAINVWNDATDQSVVLTGRKLYKDDSWNTLCLPFDVNSFSGTPLEGAIVKTLESSSFSDGTLNLNFTADQNNLTSIEAGKPYIVKWSATTPDYIENPVFTGVTINYTHKIVENDFVSFIGIYSPYSLEKDDKTILYIGANNTLYYPSEAMTIGSCRAYFRLNGITAGDTAPSRFVLNFGGEESAGVTASLSLRRGAVGDAWVTLDGRKLNGKPTTKGLFINNGKKVVIK